MRALLAAGMLGLLLLGCGPAEEEATPPVAEPTEPAPVEPGDQGAEMVIEGALGGDAQLEGGCVWLETPEGRYEVLWPEGYRSEVDPVRLVGPDGDTVAEAGDTLRVTGAVAQDMMTICQVGTIFSATAVETA